VKIHHFNSATIRPALQPLVDGVGSIANPKPVVCHCLVIETDGGLILVDSGIGLHALANPRTWLGSVFIHANRPRLDPEETAIRQLARLGYAACDVRHIVLTHLDLDHAGGIADFPDATVHVSSPEFRGATAPATPAERLRYRPVLWSRRPRWAVHELTGGERWFGFQAVGDANGLPRRSGSSRCLDTAEAMSALRYAPGSAGCCTLGMRTSTTARSMRPGDALEAYVWWAWRRARRTAEPNSGCATS
jgi:hypothetical protein